MAIIPQNELWKQFFAEYQALPELWNSKSEAYKDTRKKIAAYTKLLKVYQLLDGSANEDTLKRRIKNMRSVFARECKKVELSRQLGCSPEDEYVPNLWYYDLISFINKDQDNETATSKSNVSCDIDEEEECSNKNGVVTEYVYPSTPPKRARTMFPKTTVIPHPPPSADHTTNTPQVITLKRHISPSADNKKDEASTFAQSWATSYRKLSRTQKIYAKKAIEDVLVLGQLEALTLDTVDFNAASVNIDRAPEF